MENHTCYRIGVLQIITRLNIGGASVHAALLAAKMNPEYFHTMLVAGTLNDKEGDMNYLAEEHGVTPVYVQEMGREIDLKNDILAILRLYQLLRDVRPTIVHTHTTKAGILGRSAAILARIPIVVHTYHGHYFNFFFNSTVTRLFLTLERFFAVFTHRILVVSQQQFDEISSKFKVASADKLRVVPLGLDLTRFLNAEMHRSKLKRELNLYVNTLLVGIVGRLVPVKNHRLFLQMAQQVVQRRNDVHFAIVGDGELADELKELANELSINGKVSFLGWRKDLDVIYADLDLCVLTSYDEGTPVSLIEALASATPVVSTAVGGVPDVVEHLKTGLVVPSNDVQALTSAVMQLLADKERRIAYGCAGRAAMKEKYGIERLICDIEQLYEELLQRYVRKE